MTSGVHLREESMETIPHPSTVLEPPHFNRDIVHNKKNIGETTAAISVSHSVGSGAMGYCYSLEFGEDGRALAVAVLRPELSLNPWKKRVEVERMIYDEFFAYIDRVVNTVTPTISPCEETGLVLSVYISSRRILTSNTVHKRSE